MRPLLLRRALSSAAAAAQPAVSPSAASSGASKGAFVVANGNPATSIETRPLGAAQGALGSGDVRLKLVKAAVQREDLDAVARRKDAVNAVAGGAAVFQVAEVGSGVKDVAAGDRVAPVSMSFGAWRSEAVASADKLAKLPKDFSNAADLYAHAAAIKLLDGVKQGSVVAVNGAQFPLGTALAYVGASKGLKVVCVVGAGAGVDATRKRLVDAGAAVSCVEGFDDMGPFTGSAYFRKLVADLPPAALVVNQVGGSVAHDLARMLGQGGRLVTLGGAPLSLPASLFVDKQIVATGWSLRGWMDAAGPSEVRTVLSQAAESVTKGGQRAATTTVDFSLDQAAMACEAWAFGPAPVIKP